VGHDNLEAQLDKLGWELPPAMRFAVTPAIVEPDVAAGRPAQLLEGLSEHLMQAYMSKSFSPT
jgi:hypothetical protein